MLNKQRTSEATRTTTTTGSSSSSKTTLSSRLGQEEKCSHSVYIKGLCGNCGVRLDPPQSSSSVSMIHSVPELKVSEEYAKEIGKADQERLINERKLVLLVDLDQTILHTTHEEVKNDPNVHSFKLWPGHPTYYTKLRPFLQEFLDEMLHLYELHIFTFGCRLYAHKIASIIDPNQRYFGNRILSRDESVDQYSKRGNLNNLFPCGDAMVCIIDDRSDVWREAGNLIRVKPYSYFKTSISDGAMRRAAAEEDDAQLDCDADKLQALLDLDDEDIGGANDDENDKDYSDSDDSNGERTNEDDDDDSESQQDNTKGDLGEELKREQDSPTEELEKEGERKEKKLKQDDGDKQETTDDSQRDTRQDKQDSESEDSSQANEDEQSKDEQDKKSPSSCATPSPKVEEDLDTYLLLLRDILKRIHEKWYMELDESREFLTAEESYKLPAIKDIISRYFKR